MEYKLFEDQLRVYNALSASVSKNNKVLCYAPTGFGKTILSKVIIDKLVDRGKRVLFLTPRIKLSTQTQERFGYGNLILGEKTQDNGSMLSIGSIQSVLSRKIDTPFDFIFIDEAHFAHGSEYMKYVFDTYPNSKYIALSATPIDENGYLLDGYDDIVAEVTLHELIKSNRLVDVEVYTSKNQPDLSGVQIVNGDYNQEQASEVLKEEAVMGNTLDEWERYGGALKTLAFATNISHAEKLTREFLDKGTEAASVHSKMSADKIEQAYDDFKNDKIQVLINVDMATFGFDEPSIQCLLFARPIKSLRLYKQMVGRGLRTHEGKDKCVVIDCANVVRDNGYPTDEIPFIKKPIISRKLDRLINAERSVNGDIPDEIPAERIDYLQRISSLFDLYSDKVYGKESDLQDDVRTFLKRAGIFHWRQNSGTMFKDGRWVHFTDKKGLPDLTILYNGVYIGIELKLPKGRFTTDQMITIPEMIYAGIHVFIIDNFYELFNTIDLIKNNIIKTKDGVLIKNGLYLLSDNQIRYRTKLNIK